MKKIVNIKTKYAIQKMVLSAMFVALGVVLPFFTGQIQQIGNMLLPMHLPVFLCSFICGWQYGIVVGMVLPLLRSLIFVMPTFYPTAIAMSIELAAYGFVAGFIYNILKKQNIISVYISMLPAMVLGRVVWGLTQIILLGIQSNSFTWQAFISGALLNAVPGIILQLILIPAIMSTLNATGVLKYKNG